MYFIYIIRTKNNKLYIGHSNNLERRELQHHLHLCGAKFLRDNKVNFQIVYVEKYDTRAKAMKREKQFKGWTRAKKEALISQNIELLKKL